MNEQTNIRRQESIELRLHRDSQEQFSLKGVPGNCQKTETFLRIIQQLDEQETWGQNHFLMHVPFPFETIVFYQHYLVHHEHSGPWTYRGKSFPILRSMAAPSNVLQQHLETVHLTTTTVTGY